MNATGLLERAQTLAEMIADADLSELLYNEDRVTLADGSWLELIVESDDTWSDPSDRAECWGDGLAWVPAKDSHDYSRINDRCTTFPRPDGFTGAAEIVQRYDGGAYWWQPAAGRGCPDYWAERRSVLDLIEYGPVSVALLLWRSCGDCGKPELIVSESVGWVEPFPSETHTAELVSDLRHSLSYWAGQGANAESHGH